MKFREAIFGSLAVATFVLVVETLVVLVLTGAHYAGLLRQHATSLRLWSAYAGIFLVPGAALWLLVAAASRVRTPHRPLAAVLLLAALALPLVHAPTVLGPALRRAYTDPRALGAVAVVMIVVSVWLLRAIKRGKRRPFYAVAVALAVVTAGLSVVDVCMILRSADQVLSAAGMRHVVLGVSGAALIALPLLVAFVRAIRGPAVRWLAGALGFYAAAYAAIVAFTPTAPQKLPSPETGSLSGAPSILMIVVDTLREDVVSGPDDPSGLTPNIERLARDGVWFEEAYAPSPWTTPSFASILTSTYPSTHHAGHRDPVWGFRNPMTRSLPTLTEILSGAGYWTGAATTNPHLARQFGLYRGFHVYRNLISAWTYHAVLAALRERGLLPGHGTFYLVGRDQTTRTEELIRRGRESGRPFFVLAHYMDPHSPYHAPEIVGNAPENPSSMVEDYRAEVAYSDHYVGELLQELRDKGLYDDMMVILTADHGEELTELRQNPPNGRRVRDHGHTLFNEALRIPLVVKYPGNAGAGTARSDLVSLIDLAPTILHVVGLDPPEEFIGRDLLEGDDAGGDRILFAEGIAHGPEQKSCVRGTDKVILHSLPPHEDYARAYDLAADPGEKDPLPVDAEDGRFIPLYHALVDFTLSQEAITDTNAVEIDPHILRQLKALGYVN